VVKAGSSGEPASRGKSSLQPGSVDTRSLRRVGCAPRHIPPTPRANRRSRAPPAGVRKQRAPVLLETSARWLWQPDRTMAWRFSAILLSSLGWNVL
jgi:hypothetical protein